MSTLSTYKKRLKKQSDFNLTQLDKQLSTKRFCKYTFKLLKKNLNFVPTQKTINKEITI